MRTREWTLLHPSPMCKPSGAAARPLTLTDEIAALDLIYLDYLCILP